MFLGVVVGILILSVMVFVHEFAHLIIAKLASMNAPIFSIGLGPKLFSFLRWGETEFRVSLIPFGGYVEIKGMNPEEMKGEEDEFYSKNFFLKSAVAFSGPFANFVFGFLVFVSVIFFNGIEAPSTTAIKKVNKESNLLPGDKILKVDEKEVKNWYELTEKLRKNSKVFLVRESKEIEVSVDSLILDSLEPFVPPCVGNVLSGFPAEKAGIKEGDWILRIQDREINSWEDITEVIHPAFGETLNIVFLRKEDTLKASVVPEPQKTIEGDSIVNIGVIGIESSTDRVNVPFYKAFIFGWRQTYNTALWGCRTISFLFKKKISPKEVSGPLGIVIITKKTIDRGFVRLLMLVGVITINLAIINLIPIPPLDGFHIAMSLVTFNSKKPPSKKILKIIQGIGTFILVALMILILFNDIIKFIQRQF
ncbi:MAG: RIP metalloprotease RseP [candidate division WOR-3 bacterium]